MSVSTMPTRLSPGRPYIGPKVQTHVHEEIDIWVREDAARRGIPTAYVYRELIEFGAQMRYGKAQ